MAKTRVGIIYLIAATLIIAQPLCFVLSGVALPHASSQYAYAEDDTGDTSEEEPEPEPEEVDVSALNAAISDATDAKKGVRPSTDGTDITQDTLWASQPVFNALNASINFAKERLSDKNAVQEDIDQAAATLTDAIQIFKKSLMYGTKSDVTEKPKEVVNALYLKMDEAGSDGKKHFAGEDFDSKYKTLSITVKGRIIQLNAYFTTNLSDGVMYETADGGNPLGEIAVEWRSSDNEIATVSPNGLITPISDGDVTITATVAEESKYEGAAPAKSVQIKISGQTAEYVSNVAIIDNEGNSLSSKNDAVTVIEGKNKFFEFYALVTWHDPKTETDRVEDTRKDKITSTIKWVIGGSGAFATINEETGRLKTGEYSGNCFVQCNVTGGNGGVTVKDKAVVTVDTGEYKYLPAPSLKLKVVYQEFPDKVVQEHTYSLSELASSLSAQTGSYTIVGNGRFGVITAAGYLFKDIVALEGVELDEVYQFRFGTADGYDNPITSKLLYGSGARYYFPNWDIGSRAGAVPAPPILAYESSITWGESMADPTTILDEGTRFRLVFGPLWGGESNSSHQIYYIQAVTIVLAGSPPASNGNGDGLNSGDGNDGEGGGYDSSDDTPADKTGGGGDSGGSGDGNGGGGAGGNGNGGGGSGVNATGTGSSLARGDASDGSVGSSAETTSDTKVSGGTNIFARSMGTESKTDTTGGNWKLYEMISNAKSNVAELDMDLPYVGLAIPIACGGVAVGGLSFFIGFRRRLI
jgi:hypothetical protein